MDIMPTSMSNMGIMCVCVFVFVWVARACITQAGNRKQWTIAAAGFAIVAAGTAARRVVGADAAWWFDWVGAGAAYLSLTYLAVYTDTHIGWLAFGVVSMGTMILAAPLLQRRTAAYAVVRPSYYSSR